MCFNSFWHFYALQIPNSATFVWSAPSFHVILDQKHVVSRPFLSSKNPYFQNEAKCKNFLLIMSFIIRCKFFFLFIGRELTSWPANKCLQIMVCSCALSSNFVWLQILFCSCINETTLFSFCDRSCVKMADRFTCRRYSLRNKLGDRMIKQLLNSVIAKYRDLSGSRTSVIYLSLRLRQITDLLATDKSQYFAQPRSIIVNFLHES